MTAYARSTTRFSTTTTSVRTEDAAGDHRHVALERRLAEEAAETRQVKGGLDEDDARERGGDR